MSLSNRSTLLILVVLMMAATAFTVATYSTFNHTYDEPNHIAAGMELVDQGRYDYDLTHGPLSRIAVAIGPYLNGSRSHGAKNLFDEGRAILYESGDYQRTLTLARLGNLPFLILLLTVMFLWGRRVGGNITGLLAVFFIATLPPILGNAAVATTDLAAAATGALALYAATVWLEHRTAASGALIGASCGLAVAAKLSAVPFLVTGFAALALCVLIVRPKALGQFPMSWWAKSGVMATLGALVALWLAFGAQFDTPANMDSRIVQQLDDHLPDGALQDAAIAVADKVPVPIYFVKLPLGFRWAVRSNERGHMSYLLGEVSMDGWWYYYPINVAVRTPLPLLLLGLAGLVVLGVHGWRSKSWQLLFPAAAFVSIMVLCMVLIRFNLGLRHVFILFAPLAVAAAYTAHVMFQAASRFWLKAAAVGLVAWQAVTPVIAMPDHLAYFNSLGGKSAEEILVVADLDWGQDLKRLEKVLQERGISKIHLAYQGSANLAREPLPSFELLKPGVPVKGWVAISLAKKLRGGPAFAWLDDHDPVERVGRSIDLYYIEQTP